MLKAKIYVAGHSGLLGSAIIRRLVKDGYKNIVTRSHQEVDLTAQSEVDNFLKREKPDFVVLAAARVGGIKANIQYPAQFLYDNLCIQTNVINSSFRSGVKKLLFFGSACSYPRECPQPMKEEYLLSGYLEPTNEPYAIAKIAGIKLCQAYNRQYGTNFISAVPTNIYGPDDDFNSDDSHVIPALINRLHKTKIKKEAAVVIWGSGKPKREFIYAQDAADAAIFLIKNYDGSCPINIGSGQVVSVKELVRIVKEIVGYEGEVIFDRSKPDGAPHKSLDGAKLKKLGWQARVTLADGIRMTYQWYLKNSKGVHAQR